MKQVVFGILAVAFGSCAIGVSGQGRAEMEVVPLEPIQVHAVNNTPDYEDCA